MGRRCRASRGFRPRSRPTGVVPTGNRDLALSAVLRGLREKQRDEPSALFIVVYPGQPVVHLNLAIFDSRLLVMP